MAVVPAQVVASAARSLRAFGARALVSRVRRRPRGGARGVLRVSPEALPQLRGHFPGRPALPAVCLLEAMFQVAAVAAEGGAGREVDVVGVEQARFRRIVGDGEEVCVVVEREQGQGVGREMRFHGRAFVVAGEDQGGGEVAVGDARFGIVLHTSDEVL